jgi:protein gp37
VKGHPYERGFDLRLVPEALDLPRSWRKPRRVFVNSMSDLFHEGVPFDFIEDVFATMAETPRHAYIVLTKRAARMAEFVAWLAGEWGPFQLPNVTLGVSVGTRERLPEIEILRQTPAAIRMVSFEPLLEDLGDVDLRGIDFAAIGGESGPKARPCDVAWIRSLVAQCRTANVAPYVKQLGTAWARAAPGRGHADRKGADMSEWPEDLRIRHFPAPHGQERQR